MSPAKPKNTWSLITRMRLGLLLLFIPVLLLGSIYYLHMERTQRHGESAQGVVVIRISPDNLSGMAGGQQIPGAGSGIELLVGLPGWVDQHLAMLGAHVDVIELHHLVIGLPLLQVVLAVKDLRAAEILIIYLLINQRKLALERLQIGFEQGMQILGIAGNQILLLLIAQGALHMQVVDAAQQQNRDKEQEEAQPHAGD